MTEYRFFYRRHLPHYQPQDATLFVTCRLAGSLPAHVIAQIKQEAAAGKMRVALVEDPQDRSRLADQERRRSFGRWDKALDAVQEGPRWLEVPAIADLVADSLRRRDPDVFELYAYCVMPTHVHIVFRITAKDDGSAPSLAAVLHSFKRYIAREANKILHRDGQFWQHESYDHAVRDEAELRRIIAYVANNPVKAGLVSEWQAWRWTYFGCRAAEGVPNRPARWHRYVGPPKACQIALHDSG
jgi:REP element-mobilizing transposase RayT